MKNFITVKKNLTSNKKIFEKKTIKCNNNNSPPPHAKSLQQTTA